MAGGTPILSVFQLAAQNSARKRNSDAIKRAQAVIDGQYEKAIKNGETPSRGLKPSSKAIQNGKIFRARKIAAAEAQLSQLKMHPQSQPPVVNPPIHIPIGVPNPAPITQPLPQYGYAPQQGVNAYAAPVTVQGGYPAPPSQMQPYQQQPGGMPQASYQQPQQQGYLQPPPPQPPYMDPYGPQPQAQPYTGGPQYTAGPPSQYGAQPQGPTPYGYPPQQAPQPPQQPPYNGYPQY